MSCICCLSLNKLSHRHNLLASMVLFVCYTSSVIFARKWGQGQLNSPKFLFVGKSFSCWKIFIQNTKFRAENPTILRKFRGAFGILNTHISSVVNSQLPVRKLQLPASPLPIFLTDDAAD